jgi:hypothetical protein
MNGLVFLMIGGGEKDRRQLVERDLAVRLRIGDLRRGAGGFQNLVVRMPMMQRPRRTPRNSMASMPE